MSNWIEKELGEVCTLQRGFDLPTKQRKEGDYPLISSSGFTDMQAEAKVSGPGVVTGRSGSIGSVFFIDQDFWPLNTTLYVKDFHGNDPRFIYYLLRKFDLKRFTSGTGVPTLNRNNVHSELVYIPSEIDEQKRIVAIVDQAFEAIDVAIENTKQNLANARELFESYLNAIFTQGNSGWVERKLGDTEIIQIIDGDRGTNYPQKSDFQIKGHCLFLNTKNVRPNGFNFDATMFITEEKDKSLRKGKLNRRDVLLTTRGTIGNIAVYNENVKFDHIRINSGMLILRPNEKFITSEYLFEVLRSSKMKSQIEKLTSGAAQPQLPIKTLVNFTFPAPTQIEDQHKIVLSLYQLSEQTQRLEAIYRQKLAALTELKQSILQKAFTGELTAKKEAP
jgi:type I restriction enzyme, S subunit